MGTSQIAGDDSSNTNNGISNKGKYLAIDLLVLMVCGSIAIAVFFLHNWEYVTKLEGEGYLGLFLISTFLPVNFGDFAFLPTHRRRYWKLPAVIPLVPCSLAS